ncbi:hypothetical protein BA768_11395 [Chryseobacterium sp. CBo1]|uniref:hypothetical protein n=1 Tax=Chryseobacterium sp. CBo1 TaxID=1869230 RepID=UPI0008109470|nr:hypothetical protein [Chryseobacterium sp. CBo1]OCK52458.1 hypothetical protein BA768_11395 [Chryseobacterium sp. CBo1]
MKKIALLAICAMFSNSLFSQQWDGATNLTDHIYRNGKVSIGTDNNNDKLNLNGNFRLTGNSGNKIVFGGGSTSPVGSTIVGDDGNFHFEFNDSKLYLHPYVSAYFGDVDPNPQLKNAFSMGATGIVGMGTDNFYCSQCSGYRLFVKDGIKTEKVQVEIAVSNGWADYVFQKDYKLMPLQELQSYITDKGHLPEVPTTEEAIANGIELKEMNILLLKKIEELTLYTLQQQKNIEEQNTRIEMLEKKISTSK